MKTGIQSDDFNWIPAGVYPPMVGQNDIYRKLLRCLGEEGKLDSRVKPENDVFGELLVFQISPFFRLLILPVFASLDAIGTKQTVFL